MPDVYAKITEIAAETQERLVDVLEMRVTDPRQRAMWEAYLSEIAFPPTAEVLEIGCGTGAVSRMEACVHAFRTHFVHDPWIVCRLPQLIRAGGFEVMPTRSHGYVEALEAGYMQTWIERGADVLLQAGQIGTETAEALKAEARQRSSMKVWFGHIAFASVLSRKPA